MPSRTALSFPRPRPIDHRRQPTGATRRATLAPARAAPHCDARELFGGTVERWFHAAAQQSARYLSSGNRSAALKNRGGLLSGASPSRYYLSSSYGCGRTDFPATPRIHDGVSWLHDRWRPPFVVHPSHRMPRTRRTDRKSCNPIRGNRNDTPSANTSRWEHQS